MEVEADATDAAPGELLKGGAAEALVDHRNPAGARAKPADCVHGAGIVHPIVARLHHRDPVEMETLPAANHRSDQQTIVTSRGFAI